MIQHNVVRTKIDGVEYIAYRDREEARDHAAWQTLSLPRGVSVSAQPARSPDGDTWWVVPDDGSQTDKKTKKNPRFVFKSIKMVKRHVRAVNRKARRPSSHPQVKRPNPRRIAR